MAIQVGSVVVAKDIGIQPQLSGKGQGTVLNVTTDSAGRTICAVSWFDRPVVSGGQTFQKFLDDGGVVLGGYHLESSLIEVSE